MALPIKPSGWDKLPDEILLHILSFLKPYNITRLQLVSRKLQKLCLDDKIWKHYCFSGSAWYQALKIRRQRLADPFDSRLLREFYNEVDIPTGEAQHSHAPPTRESREVRERQDMANWDPSFPGERISWYDEYIQRAGPTTVNWLQNPRIREKGVEAIIEARGVALYKPYDGEDGLGTMLAVSPLDDGSVCLWDVRGTRARQGSIIARSKRDILFFDGPGSQNAQRSKKIDTGVTECVSVDNHSHRAFFAVQSHLIEVDLNRLAVVSRESFEWSITTLSSVDAGVPLTVGTTLGVHLHDFRARSQSSRNVDERMDGYQWDDSDVFRAIFDTKPLPPYASLSQPTPISILHLPRPGSHSLVSDEIYISGRFSNILRYDRRKFPAIMGSIYSGALINSLAALPYPFSTVDNEVRRHAEFSAERVHQMKANGAGVTVIAGGMYKSKGSLEIYGLGSAAHSAGSTTLQNSTMKNRQTAASGSILSVTNHGTKIVFSDAAGLLKWFERDGSTECRRLKIGHSDAEQPMSLFASMPASDDLARKIISTQWKQNQDRTNNDNILFWTGDRLGMVSFTSEPLFTARDIEGEKQVLSEEEQTKHLYSQRMRDALMRQADGVRFARSLGLGPGSG